METTNMRAQTTLMLFTVGAIFGSSFLLVKLLVGEMPPEQITAWRLLFGGMTIAIILAARRELRLPTRSLVASSTVLTLLDSVIPNTLLAWAQIRIDSGIAAVLISSMPLFTVIFALLIPKGERVSLVKASGLVIGIAGVAVLVGADAQRATSAAPGAHLAVILAAMSQAASVVYARTLLGKESPMELSGLKLLLGAAIALAFTAVLNGGHAVPQMGAHAWVTLLALGVLSNAVGRTMYLSLIASAGSIRASLVAYIVPVVGVLLGCLVLGERMSPGAAAGFALIAFGMALVTHGPQLLATATRHLSWHAQALKNFTVHPSACPDNRGTRP